MTTESQDLGLTSHPKDEMLQKEGKTLSYEQLFEL